MGGRDREFGMGVYPLLYLKRITNEDLLCSIGNSAQYYVTTKLGKNLEKCRDMYVCN